ncbi:MAG TPA: hypothetical protein VIU61_07905 [Kofleriaceae bacterium]
MLALLLFASCASNDTTTEAKSAKTEPAEPSAKTTRDNLATEEVERQRGEKELVTEEKTRVKYHAAVTTRLAKLDTAIAATRDVPANLRSRRNAIEVRIGEMPATADATWPAYTQDLDAKFVAIERDLRPQ